MKDALIVSTMSVIPKKLGSKLQGVVGRLGLSRLLIRWYARKYKVDTDAMVGEPSDYASLQDFFVRELKPGTRPICEDADALVSPSDSKVYAFGTVTPEGRLPMGTGMDFDVATLVGGDPRFKGGEFAILYLSPRDYHRVHHPVDGTVTGMEYLPGALWPVFPAATRKVDGLFARNERLVTLVDTPSGRVAVVMVGAYGVGRMTAAFDPIITNTDGDAQSRGYDPGFKVARGEELGRFNLGSTVILVLEPGAIEWELERDRNVLVGQRLGQLRPRPE